jgi:AraC-like DNA-binding protein
MIEAGPRGRGQLHTARHQSDRYRWEMVTRPAPAALRGVVRNYTGYEEWSAEPLCRREVPSADVTLILSPDSELRLPERHTSFVAALHDRCALVEHPGEQRGVEVRLTPLGARALFGVPMHELTNRVVELDELGVRSDLAERIWDAEGWDGRFGVVDRALTAALDEAHPPSRELAWAWGKLLASDGRAAIGALAQELGWSHRRLIGRFREGIGMPPKALARVLRFQRVSRLLREAPEPRLAEVAFDCGYYDQAHLNRDFREFAGTTPGEYLASRLPDGGGVKSVQDAQSAAA